MRVEVKPAPVQPVIPDEVVLTMTPEEAQHLRDHLCETLNHATAPQPRFDAMYRIFDELSKEGFIYRTRLTLT